MTATAATAAAPTAAKPRKDNIFGICNAVGEDFGFNPFFLRLAFAASLLYKAEYTLMAYFGLGLIVLASHLLIRNRRTAKPAVTVAEQPWVPEIPAIHTAEPVREKALA